MSQVPNRSTLSSVGISIVVHTLILGAMWFIKENLIEEPEDYVVESVIKEEDRIPEEITQKLTEETAVSQNMNTISGGSVTMAMGSTANPSVKKVQYTESEILKTDLTFNASVSMPGDSELGDDLGEGEVTGEIGAVVDGYGPALHRLTQEILRMMREQKVMVVWLFDQSDSMKDDHKEIAEQFHKVYDELGIAQQKDEKLKTRIQDQILQTMIVAYGQGLVPMLKEPTADVKLIKEAITKIPIDETGKENMCKAIQEVVGIYAQRVQRDKRRLVIVVVSDESGDDGQEVEKTIQTVTKLKPVAPVYILGRESVFGYPYARLRWQDPKYKLWHWLRINRGPETAYPECLQWDGLHHRWDVFNAGFGPYEQVRIARQSGGIFFILPGEEEDLSGTGARQQREYEFLSMRKYTPMLLPRSTYADSVKKSEFRSAIWEVIVMLNPDEHQFLPSHNPQLNIREHWYPLAPAEFRAEAEREVIKAAAAMLILNRAIGMLEKIKPLRDSENFDRWRANYDLIHAQCVAYRVRLFQFLLAMDDHANHMPKPVKEKPKTNRWNVARTRKMIVPDEGQFERLKKAFNIKMGREEYLAYVKAEEDRAVGMYNEVIANHPGTPWEERANYELRQGFGMHFVEAYRDPNYDRPDIKLPKP